MSQRITIEIKDKIATCLTELPVVCGNSDYVVDFVFDEEWNAHEVKTAIFVVNGKAIPQVFAGNVCPIPVIQNTLIAWVGVFAGTVDDGTLSTSTPALVKCVPCITDGDNVPAPPPDDVYNQIIGLINSGMLRGEQGEKGEKGDKGDAGSIKFIPVATLPTENIDESAIYLVPIEGEDEQNRFTEYVYIDGKWEEIGAITVQVDHSEYVKFTDYATADKAGVIKAYQSYGFNINRYNGIPSAAQFSINDYKNGSVDMFIGKGTLENIKTQYVKEGLTTDEKWTDEEKAAACGTIGAVEAIKTSEITDVCFLYGTDEEGNRKLYRVLDGIGARFIPIRNGWGGLDVPAPQRDNHATNRGYVDGLIAELRAEIAALKGE